VLHVSLDCACHSGDAGHGQQQTVPFQPQLRGVVRIHGRADDRDLWWIVVGSVAFPRDSGMVWLMAIAGSLFTLLVVWLLRDRPEGSLRESFAWLSRKPAEAPVDYEPKVKRAERVRYGTNRPPTAEELRDLKDGDRNWVPSNTPAGQRRPRRK
jgi:hypothetical protein